jgi:hypothetical protein
MKGNKIEYEFEAKLADKTIRYCTTCKQCWEIVRRITAMDGKKISLKNVYYYKNFPSYGKEKVTCLHCSNLTKDEFVDKFYTRKIH